MSNKPKSTATKEEAKPAVVPKLRFPEFHGTEGWYQEFLKDSLSSISNGLALEQGNGTSGYRVTRIETVSAGTIDLAKVGLVQTSEDISEYKLRVGDILLSNINSVAHIGKSVFVDREYNLYHGMNLLRLEVKRDQHEPKFIFYAINTDWIRASLRERSNKAVNQASINQTELGNTEIFLPHRSEQQKIANCLSSVDEVIAAQARKLDALKTHKKGLMQQIFPREGETQPRLRFPEFQNAGEWREERLDDLVDFQDGYAFKSTDFINAQEDATQVIRITDINNKNTNEDKVYIPTSFFERSKLSKYCVDDGDLLLSLTGAAGFNFFFWNGGRAAINQRTAKLTAKRKSGGALLRLLEPLIHEKINERGEGQNNNLSKEFLSTIVLLVPEPNEQHCIASCLSSLDALLAVEAQKHEALQRHKLGLMQQLFPSPEEVEA